MSVGLALAVGVAPGAGGVKGANAGTVPPATTGDPLPLVRVST